MARLHAAELSAEVIAFDAVAAWHLGRRGYDVSEWLANLRRHREGVEGATGQGTVTWRLRADRPPSGAWFSTLEVTVREDGAGTMGMDNLRLPGGIYLTPRDGISGILLDDALPDTVVSALPGRLLGDLVDLPPVAASAVTAAYAMPDLPGIPGRTQVTFDQVIEMHETPFFLLP